VWEQKEPCGRVRTEKRQKKFVTRRLWVSRVSTVHSWVVGWTREKSIDMRIKHRLAGSSPLFAGCCFQASSWRVEGEINKEDHGVGRRLRIGQRASQQHNSSRDSYQWQMEALEHYDVKLLRLLEREERENGKKKAKPMSCPLWVIAGNGRRG
jgi:hypothetical protein